MRFKSKLPLLLLTICSFSFLFAFYGKLLLNPNKYLFTSEGDGIKNYYTYAYYINNNSSNTNFEGFNYPYGEHFFYTDGQPILSYVIKQLNSFFPSISNYHIGILNSLMLLSLLIGIYFIYLILKKNGLPPLLSSLSAIGIMVLSPQIVRMNGHLALSYSCFIPITIYLLFQYYSGTKNRVWLALLIINNLFWLFIHAYLGIIAISLVISFEFCLLLYQLIKNSSYNLKKGLLTILSAFIPICTFLFILNKTDIHTHRDTNPYGFFEYYADFDTIFLPNHGFLKDTLFHILPPFTQTSEGWAYIGLGSIITLVSVSTYSLLQIIKHKNFPKFLFNNIFLNVLFGSSIIMLLFSFAIPFRWGLEKWLDYLPIIKQFRAIGRFAWIFYFSTSIVTIYFVYRLSSKVQSKIISISISLIIPILMIAEGIPQHQKVSRNATRQLNYYSSIFLPSEIASILKKIKKEEFQAIIPLPYYLIGTENYEKEGSNQIYKLSTVMSYHLDLPILGSYLTRLSLKEGKKGISILSSTIYKKDIQKDITSKKPFLIIKSNEALRLDERNLLSRSKLIYESKRYNIYEIEYNSLFSNSIEQELIEFSNYKNNLDPVDGYWFEEDAAFFHKKEYEPLQKNRKNIIYKIDCKELKKGDTYNSSVWLKNSGENFGQDQLNFLEYGLVEINDNHIVQEKKVEVMSSSTIDNDWTRIDLAVKPINLNGTLEFYLKGNDLNNKELLIQDFFLSEESKYVYWFNSDSSILYKDNHRIKYE